MAGMSEGRSTNVGRKKREGKEEKKERKDGRSKNTFVN